MIDERTGLEIMQEEECWDLTAGKEIGRVATDIANKPDVFPVNYKLDGRDIVIHTVPGTKLATAVLGPGVAFEIDQFDEDDSPGWSAVAHGTGAEVEKVEDVLNVKSPVSSLDRQSEVRLSAYHRR